MTRTGCTVVTGASGFVGRHLIDRLRTAGAPVVGWGHARPVTAAGLRSRRVNLLDRDAVAAAIAADRPTHLIHLAGAPHVGRSWQRVVPTLQVNVLGTHHLLDAIRREAPGCRTLVVTSAMIYRAGQDALTEDAPLVPADPYGLSKLAQDQRARLAATEDGLDVVVARPFNHIGPGQDPSFAISSFARQIALIERGAAPPVLRVGNLDAERDLTDVRDVVEAYQRLLEGGVTGAAYNVCSGRAWRIGDLLDQLLAQTPAAITTEADPARLRPSDIPRLLGSHARITRELGWQPRRPIAQTLAETLAWWRAELDAGRGAV